jgi:hypothetical protein
MAESALPDFFIYIWKYIYLSPKPSIMNNQGNIDPKDTICLQEGIDITTNWREFISQYEPNGYIRAFYIPMEDIVSLAAFHKEAVAIRAYIGLPSKGDVTDIKLALVPVTAKNEDILSIPSVTGSGEEQSTIYDFTTPCPQSCDVNSPLFQFPQP